MKRICPVILAGGSGKRLWPLSRRSLPKQFASLISSETFFQQSVKRILIKEFNAPTVVTANDYRFAVREQLRQVKVDPETIMIEPEAKNTAPAVLAAALQIEKETSPDSIMLVMPCDHYIPETSLFHEAVRAGIAIIKREDGCFVTFGAQPARPDTGYGYLHLSQPSQLKPVPLSEFVEKPTHDHAVKMVASGEFLWNMGIFMFKTRDIIAAFAEHCVDLKDCVSDAVRLAKNDLDFVRLDAESWQVAQRISLDHAIMEKTESLWVVPYPGKWSDMGNWVSVAEVTKGQQEAKDGDNDVLEIDCENVMLRSETEGQVIVGLGLKDIAAVAMADAVLIADLNRAQDVKQAVNLLQEKNVPQAETFPQSHRPWGSFESLCVGNGFQVKKIIVNPGEALSLQSHVHRAEHWIVVSGSAKVTIGDQVSMIHKNQSIYVPLGAVHRLENPGETPMVLIEVQTGSYLGEDDIIRYEDRYSRN